MKKITRLRLLIMMIVFITLCLITNVFGYSDTNYKPKYGITTARVNLRVFANTSSKIIKTLPINTKLKMVGEVNGFYIVELTNSQVGAVSKKYVKQSGTSLPNAAVYENLKKYYATVNVKKAIVRSGPSTSYNSYYQLVKDAQVEVIGRIGNFSMIVSKNNLIGLIRSDLLTKTGTTTTSNSSNNSTSNKSNNTTANNTPSISTVNDNIALKNELLTLINNARKEANLSALSSDKSLSDAAQIKSDDMVKNNYFSNTSKTYGSPFKLMQDLGISYNTAGENIAGNSSIQKAFDSWMNSDTHRKNILSTSYNYIGIGITDSKTYGKIICVMFISK